MDTYRIESSSGVVLGFYAGETRRDAILKMALDAGYESVETMNASLGIDDDDDLNIRVV